jgi:transposase
MAAPTNAANVKKVLANSGPSTHAIALANKLARMAWAMMARGERYRNPVALAA